jgi:glutathione S-transferase
MLLIGMLDSPFVRRVAVSMQLLHMPYEHGNWSIGRDFERIRQFSPLGRVPALVLDDGEVLTESACILDYLDDTAGPSRALLPQNGQPRRQALRLMAFAIGAAEKGRDQIYEEAMRPTDRRHPPWVERLQVQMHGALGELERHCESRGDNPWLVGHAMTQADVTCACVYTFLHGARPAEGVAQRYPRLGRLADRCEMLEPFKSTHTPFFTPKS